MENQLSDVLKQIELNDTNYDIRYHLVFEALSLASKLNYRTGQKQDQDDKDWYILYIYLPGDKQVSWHMPNNNIEWDGHNTVTKYERCREFCLNYQ
jgi:hypothetical protein